MNSIDWGLLVSKEQRQEEQARISRDLQKQEKQNLVNSIVIDVDGFLFQGDELSQSRMLRRADTMLEGEVVDWVLSDNSVGKVTAQQLRTAARLAVDRMGEIWLS